MVLLLSIYPCSTDFEHKWLIEYDGSTTNSLIWDNRFSKIVDLVIPESESNLLGFKSTIKSNFSEVIGGPPNDVSFSYRNRYMTISACRHHSCDEKGFMWFDLETNKGLIAIINFFPEGAYSKYQHLAITSKTYDSLNNIPESVLIQIEKWLMEEDVIINKTRWKFVQ